MIMRVLTPRRGLSSMYQMSVCASRTYLSAIEVVELLFAVPFRLFEIFQGGHAASLVFATLQIAWRGLFFWLFGQDDANPPFAQADWRFEKFDFSFFVNPLDNGGHGSASLLDVKQFHYTIVLPDEAEVSAFLPSAK